MRNRFFGKDLRYVTDVGSCGRHPFFFVLFASPQVD